MPPHRIRHSDVRLSHRGIWAKVNGDGITMDARGVIRIFVIVDANP
ncbi:hypothetical protein [Nocardia sp. NPDC051463]